MKTPPNWASFDGETTMARNPEMPLVSLPAPVAATDLADPAAFPATSFAFPAALPALSVTVLALSLASAAAFLLFSESADVACDALSVTRPSPLASSFWRLFACLPSSAPLALSTACLVPSPAPRTASVTCTFILEAAPFAQSFQSLAGPFPASTSGGTAAVDSAPGTSPPCICGTMSYATFLASSTMYFWNLFAHDFFPAPTEPDGSRDGKSSLALPIGMAKCSTSAILL